MPVQNSVAEGFEQAFQAVPLERQIEHCDHYELAPLFREWLPAHQPILEAGCGSGRWVFWFVRNGWQAKGLDWSAALCARANKELDGNHFVAGDMRKLPFDDGAFGAVVALGSVEHTIEGPGDALREFRRVLRPGGIAIITVPYLSATRRAYRLLKALARPARHFGTRAHMRAQGGMGWAADWIPTGNEWSFFEYNFTKGQMRRLIAGAGFEIIREFVDFPDEGVLHNFGRMAGHYDRERGQAVFAPPGRLLRRCLPVAMLGHMLVHVARRK